MQDLHGSLRKCIRKAPRYGGALAPVAAVSSSHQGLPVGCLSFTHDLSWACQGRNGDHVWEKRCSGLDLLSCDYAPGYAALRFNTRESEVAYRSLLLRDGVRAAPLSSPVVCRIVGAPPLCAPARLIPDRTLWEGEGRAGFALVFTHRLEDQLLNKGCTFHCNLMTAMLDCIMLSTSNYASSDSRRPSSWQRILDQESILGCRNSGSLRFFGPL